MKHVSEEIQTRIAAALSMATDTRALLLGYGALEQVVGVLEHCFEERRALVIADVNTFEAAGRRVVDLCKAAGWQLLEPLVFDDPHLHAYYRHVETVRARLQDSQVVPITVGSGTVNDIVKLAAHECGRRYAVVATAASMGGYTAYGASINHQGSKQTFFCPAPVAVIADMDVIAAAPAAMNAAGYGDLVAKSPAGADWLLADALGIEPIHRDGWMLVQDRLREWVADPRGVRSGNPPAIAHLMEGLLMTGFAMQRCRSSRPASGAEHQFSHLWDMQDHHYHGEIPLHGFKVAIGTLATTRLYEALIDEPLESLDIQSACDVWPDFEELARRASTSHQVAELQTISREELSAKYIDRAALGRRLARLREVWPSLREELRQQLVPSAELEDLLAEAGSPTDSSEIGIPQERLRASFTQAQQIRRRYTVLDLATETARMPACIEQLFGENGPYAAEKRESRFL